MKLTRAERWILSNQYRILEKLDPTGGWDHPRDVVERPVRQHALHTKAKKG